MKWGTWKGIRDKSWKGKGAGVRRGNHSELSSLAFSEGCVCVPRNSLTPNIDSKCLCGYLYYISVIEHMGFSVWVSAAYLNTPQPSLLVEFTGLQISRGNPSQSRGFRSRVLLRSLTSSGLFTLS